MQQTSNPFVERKGLAQLAQADLDRVMSIVGGRLKVLRNGRIFITGGTGFVGKWLLATLLEANIRLNLSCAVTVLTRNRSAFLTAVPWLACAPHVTLLEGDVRQFRFPQESFTHVIHAATDVAVSGEALETFDTCVEGTRRVLDFAVFSGAASVLLVSSGAVYGRQPTGLDTIPEDFSGGVDPLLTSSAYAEGKRATEFLGCCYAARTALQVKIARCFAFVGPYLPLDAHFAIGNFLRNALRGETINVNGDGTVLRSYLHASDMTAWLWAVLIDGRPQTAYNVGGDHAVSMKALAETVANLAGSVGGVCVMQHPVPGAAAERYVPDVTRALSELQVAPPLDLTEAISRTLRWFEAANTGHHSGGIESMAA